MKLPVLHIVTADDVLAGRAFESTARALLQLGGARVALHVRGPRTPAAQLMDRAASLSSVARECGAVLIVNDRVDVALAAGAAGVHLGQRSAPPRRVRPLVGPEMLVGLSVHGRAEAEEADGTDYLFAGTIWASATHPARAAAGAGRLAAIRAVASVPVLAIGGVTPDRVAAARAAGAYGVAVIRGVWAADDPLEALHRYLGALSNL